MASLWRLPILFVVENNGYAQTTPQRLALAGSINARFEAFGIETQQLKTTDVVEIYGAAQDTSEQIRKTMRPRSLILETYRLAAHSKGDDTRDQAEIEYHWRFDPIGLHQERVPTGERDEIRAQCAKEVESAFLYAESATFPDVAELSRNSLRG
jgi:TPP-dependent pyruvate/acetoin dehydrogenase alpha subunit